VDNTGRACPEFELYDLDLDPLELTDVAEQPVYADTQARMKDHLFGWLRDTGDPTAEENIPVGSHDEMLAEYTRRLRS
jgi:hypothetical protein